LNHIEKVLEKIAWSKRADRLNGEKIESNFCLTLVMNATSQRLESNDVESNDVDELRWNKQKRRARLVFLIFITLGPGRQLSQSILLNLKLVVRREKKGT
jgi:hypothetical protein